MMPEPDRIDPMVYEELDLDGEGRGDGRAYHSPWELDRQSSGDLAEREYWRDMGA
jgi:hypothetical protein